MLQAWTGTAPELTICDDLAPGGKAKKLARFLRKFGGESVGLVGHMPDIGDWAAWLIGSRKAHIDFAKAGRETPEAVSTAPPGPSMAARPMLCKVCRTLTR